MAKVHCIICGGEIENSETEEWDVHPLCDNEWQEMLLEQLKLERKPKPAYTPGQSGLFKRRDGTEFNERKR